jgi:Transposase DDE domain
VQKLNKQIFLGNLITNARQQTIKAKVTKRRRGSTVESAGWRSTLINFTGMKRLNARGLKAANKMLLLAATVYNLKKWLRFTAPKTNSKVMAMLKTKAREVFCCIKKKFTATYFKADTTPTIFPSGTMVCKKLKIVAE